MKNNSAAPEPFLVPNTVVKKLPDGCEAKSGSNTLSTNIPPKK